MRTALPGEYLTRLPQGPKPSSAGTSSGTARSRALPGFRVRSLAILILLSYFLLAAGDDNARFKSLGHRLMCMCGCNQVLLECNHVGCTYSDRMRDELSTALTRGDSDDLVLQAFVQK